MSYADIVAQAYNDALTKTAADSTPAVKGEEGFAMKTLKAPGRSLRNATAGAANATLANDAGAMAHLKKGLAKGLQSRYAPHVAALGGIAAGVGAAGYGTKKYLEHQNNKMKYASEGEENMYIPYLYKQASRATDILSTGAIPQESKPSGQVLPKKLNKSQKKRVQTAFEEKKPKVSKLLGSPDGGNSKPSLMSRMGSGYDRFSGANYLQGKGANKWVARGAAPAAVAALGAGGAYLYNRNKKTKAAAAVVKKAEEKASMTDRFKKGYSEYSGANKIMRGGESLKKNNPKGGNYWSGAKRQLGRAMSNKFVAHGALPTALGAAGLGSAYAYNQYKKKNKSASLEAEIFNQTLLDINTETAFLEELAEWKEANFDFGY